VIRVLFYNKIEVIESQRHLHAYDKTTIGVSATTRQRILSNFVTKYLLILRLKI